MIIKTIIFKRKQNSKWESGIMFESSGNSNDLIIDSKGNLINVDVNNPTIYDVKTDTSYFCIDIEPILIEMNKNTGK